MATTEEGTTVADAVTAQEVLAHLNDVDYPADKDALVSAAERAGGSEEVVRALRAIPPVDYRNRDEVVRSLRLDPAPGHDRGAQARADTPPGVADAVADPQVDRVKGAERRSG